MYKWISWVDKYAFKRGNTMIKKFEDFWNTLSQTEEMDYDDERINRLLRFKTLQNQLIYHMNYKIGLNYLHNFPSFPNIYRST